MKCSPISPRAALPMMAILMVAGTARAAGTISSGSATFSILDSAPGALKPTDFRPLGAAGNYLFEDFWAYNPFFSGTSFFGVVSESYAGDTATILTDNANTPGTI